MSRAPAITGPALLLTGLLLVSAVTAAGLGAAHLPLSAVLRALRDGPQGHTEADIVLWSLRAPRIVLSALVGASLALAGVAFQALLRNDLADPFLVGVSAGASVGAEAVLTRPHAEAFSPLAAPLAAFGSAAAAMTVVYGLARQGGRVLVSSLLLAGVVVSSFLGGVSVLLLEWSDPGDAQRVQFRLSGSLQDASWTQCGVVLLFLVAGGVALRTQAQAMNLFALGEESAQQLGVNTERYKALLIVTGSLLTAATVAVAGIIGFVGLMTPHIARRLARTPAHERVLPLSALGGAALLVWADTLARALLPEGRELPVGIVTAFLGTPFFCWLLRRRSV